MKWNNFVKRQNLPKLIQEGTEYLNSPLLIKEINWINSQLPTKEKAPGPNGLISEFYEISKKEILQIF